MRLLKLQRPLFNIKLDPSSYPDVQITTQDGEGRVINGHRAILSLFSSKLNKLFLKHEDSPVITVRNISFSHLKLVVDLVYCGLVNIDQDFSQEHLDDVLNLLQVNRDVLGDTFVEDPSTKSRLVETVQEKMCEKIVIRKKSMKTESKKKEKWHIAEGKKFNILHSELDGSIDNNININYVFNENTNVDNNEELVSKSPSWDHNETEKSVQIDYGKQEVQCSFCSQGVEYSKYVKHCEKEHPESPHSELVKCQECVRPKPQSKVKIQHHINMFHPQVVPKLNEGEILKRKFKTKRHSTICCDYCELSVSYDYYRTHCKLKHSWKAELVKCSYCSKKIQDVMYRHHMKIYHPHVNGHKKDVRDEEYHQQSVTVDTDCITDSLKVVVPKRKRNSTISCDYCEVYVSYDYYRAHCKRKHSQTPWKAELVKCSYFSRNIQDGMYRHHMKVYHPHVNVHKKNVRDEEYHQQSVPVDTDCITDSPKVVMGLGINNNTKEELIVKEKKVQERNKEQEKFISKNKVAYINGKNCEIIECEYCGIDCAYSAYLNHCRKVHPLSPHNQLEKCLSCSKKFYVVLLKPHIKLFHDHVNDHNKEDVGEEHQELSVADVVDNIRINFKEIGHPMRSFNCKTAFTKLSELFAKYAKCRSQENGSAELQFKFGGRLLLGTEFVWTFHNKTIIVTQS